MLPIPEADPATPTIPSPASMNLAEISLFWSVVLISGDTWEKLIKKV